MGTMTEEAKKQLVIRAGEANQRIDLFLAHRLGISRATIQKQVRAGGVTVNGRPAIAHQLTKVQDIIAFTEVKPPARKIRSLPDVPEPTVIAETDDYIVIEKPAGLLSHAKQNSDEPSVASWAQDRDPDIVRVGELDRPGIVHRLDRNVSGLMVIARSPEMFEKLKEQFKTHQILKVYTALVIGAPKTDEGTIRFRLARSARSRGRMAARPLHEEGKDAATQFTVIRKFRTTTLLSVKIFTGRTHQIRAHLMAYGIPVVGDVLYRHRHPKAVPPPFGRPFLHALRLGFEDLQGIWREFESPLPQDCQNYLDHLEEPRSSEKLAH